MVFGQIKTIIEENLINSYNNKKLFSETIIGFKKHFLPNKIMAEMYLIYGQLTTPMSLSKEDAKDFLEEGLSKLRNLKGKITLPKTKVLIENNYSDIDNIIYNNSDISNIIESKKKILNILMSNPVTKESTIQLPISSMVKIANKTINEHLNTLDEDVRKDILEIMNEKESNLKTTFEEHRTDVLNKLDILLKEENDADVKQKIETTIKKVKTDDFSKLNFYKLKKLKEVI